MVKLVPMDGTDFDAYVEYSAKGYADEQVKNGNWEKDTALERAHAEYKRLLPDGVHTKDNHIFSIVVEEQNLKLGVLWIGIRQEGTRRRGFIYDFVIMDEQYRGKGYGKQAMVALEDVLRSMQVDFIELHVFAHNTNAIGLYKKMGYEITNMYMRKNIKP